MVGVFVRADKGPQPVHSHFFIHVNNHMAYHATLIKILLVMLGVVKCSDVPSQTLLEGVLLQPVCKAS